MVSIVGPLTVSGAGEQLVVGGGGVREDVVSREVQVEEFWFEAEPFFHSQISLSIPYTKSISGQPPAILRVKEQPAKKGGMGKLSHPPFLW